MKAAYRDVLKHSAVYGVGLVLSRMASFLLLPLYTSYLRPGDYGCLAILDLTAALLGSVIGAGMAATANRYHFEVASERGKDKVWWTSLWILAFMALVIAVPAWMARDVLARLAFGNEETAGAFYFSLVLPNLCLATANEFLFQYLRVRKWSGLTVVISLVDLLLRICLNVWFLVVMRLGLVSVLWGNLIASAIISSVLLAIFVQSRGPMVLHWPLVAPMLRFGGPLVVTALLATLMHQANRYILNHFMSLDRVGIYSMAHAIGQGVMGLIASPFAAIWGAVVYDVAAYPDAKHVYTVIFKYYVYFLALALFGVSLFARPIVAIMAAPDYADAADLVPVVCLAYLFFGLHTHFCVPALLAKKTVHTLPSIAIATAFAVGTNFILVPVWGCAGAAWSCVGTFALYSFLGLLIYRRIDRYDYPLARCGLVIAGMAACCLAMRHLELRHVRSAIILPGAGLVWLLWAVALFGRLAQRGGQLWREGGFREQEVELMESTVENVA